MPIPVVVNARFKAAPVTGVQRAASELLLALQQSAVADGMSIDVVAHSGQGLGGHLWEQCVLWQRARRSILWSPANTGPIAHARHCVSIYDVSPLEHPEWFSWRYVWWYKGLWHALARNAIRVIAPSEDARERIERCLPQARGKVRVVRCGVAKGFFANDSETPSGKTINGFATHRPYILSLGSLEPRKNLPRLIAAWNLAKPEIRQVAGDAVLVVAGGPGKAAVFSCVEDLGSSDDVVFLGRVADDDLPALYRSAMAFAYVSLYEGFGLPSLEALASGTPVVAANTTSIPEVVGECGIYVDPHAVAGIAEGLIAAASMSAEKRAEYRRTARTRAAAFAWESAARDLTGVFREAVGR